jgi:hypothetical protein
MADAVVDFDGAGAAVVVGAGAAVVVGAGAAVVVGAGAAAKTLCESSTGVNVPTESAKAIIARGRRWLFMERLSHFLRVLDRVRLKRC